MTDKRDKGNARVVKKSLLTVVVMFGFGYALVPIYNLVCEAFGINGITEQISEKTLKASKIDKSRLITVEFDSNISNDLPWVFKPMLASVQVHPGQAMRINYIAVNNSDKAVTGQARHSVIPIKAAAHFKKTECFCYSKQTLKAGEKKTMPVLFVIDPAVPKDVRTVTLSYTFFKMPGQTAALGK